MPPSLCFLCGLVLNCHSRLNSTKKQRRQRRREEKSEYGGENRAWPARKAAPQLPRRRLARLPRCPPAASPVPGGRAAVRAFAGHKGGNVPAFRRAGSPRAAAGWSVAKAASQLPACRSNPKRFTLEKPLRERRGRSLSDLGSVSFGLCCQPGTALRRHLPLTRVPLFIYSLFPWKAAPRGAAAASAPGLCSRDSPREERGGGSRSSQHSCASHAQFCAGWTRSPSRSGLPGLHGRTASALSWGGSSRLLPVSECAGHVRCPRSPSWLLPAALAGITLSFWRVFSASSPAPGQPGRPKSRALLKAAGKAWQSRAAGPGGSEPAEPPRGVPAQEPSCPATCAGSLAACMAPGHWRDGGSRCCWAAIHCFELSLNLAQRAMMATPPELWSCQESRGTWVLLASD